jgi:hypothetical protein
MPGSGTETAMNRYSDQDHELVRAVRAVEGKPMCRIRAAVVTDHAPLPMPELPPQLGDGSRWLAQAQVSRGSDVDVLERKPSKLTCSTVSIGGVAQAAVAVAGSRGTLRGGSPGISAG